MKSLVLVPAILLATAGTAAAEEKTITLEEAISLATEGSFAVDVGKESIESAKSHKRSTKTLRLPTLAISANLLVWNDEIAESFVPGTPPVTLRNQITGDVSISIYQPITAATVLGRLIEGDQAAIETAQAELDVTKLDVAYQAAEAYLGALQLQTLREVATATVTQFEANLVQIRALRDAQVLSDLDVLRLEAARDSAKQAVLEAEGGYETAVRGLALLLDLPDGTDLVLSPVDTTPPELGWSEDEAVELARKQRPEMRVQDARVEQVEVGVDVARAQYLPSLNAVASYTHSEQGGPFEIKDAAFIGLQLQWNVWDWGQRKHDIAEARAASRVVKRAREETVDAIAFDVRAKWLAASTQRKSLDVAESALKAAEEAYRLQTVKIQAGVATSTDVIDAEAEVSRARSQATIARYQYLISWMALVRAVGQIPGVEK